MCNGSTTDSDSVCEGSNPSPAAKGKSLESLVFTALSGLFSLSVNKMHVTRRKRRALTLGAAISFPVEHAERWT